MDYFCVCVGSVGLSILELGSARWLSGFLNDPPTHQWKPDSLQSRSGLRRSRHSGTPHLLYLAFIIIIIFHPKDPKHLTCPSSSSHVNTLIQDLVFPRIILKSQDYYILVLCHTFMTCLMLFKETGFHHQIHKMHQRKTIHFIKLRLTLNNWCLRTVVLEKTLESPLNCKENKPVNPKGNQLWIFIGKTDAEAETPILWPPDAKSWLTAKDPDAGKDWGQKEKRVAEDEMVRQHHWVSGYESEQTALLQTMGSQRVRYDIGTKEKQEQQSPFKNKKAPHILLAGQCLVSKE